jgi:hypothetical protein
MTPVEPLQFSLDAALDVQGQVTAGLTQEQAGWRPPGNANTAGSIYGHTLTCYVAIALRLKVHGYSSTLLSSTSYGV